MAVVRKIVLYLLLAVITLSDWVLVVIHQVREAISKLTHSLRIFRRSGKIKKSQTLYKSRTFPRLADFINSSIVMYFSILSTFSAVIQGVTKRLIEVALVIPQKLQTRLSQQTQKTTASPKNPPQKKRGRPAKKQIYKPSFLYKLKFFSLGAVVSFIFLFIPILSIIFISELPDPSNLSVSYAPKTTKFMTEIMCCSTKYMPIRIEPSSH